MNVANLNSIENRALGIRAESTGINWAVVKGTLEKPILHDTGKESAPHAYNEAESLGWIRQRVLDIIDQFKPAQVAVRYPEPTAQGANRDSAKARCRVEGVVLEAANARNLQVVTGALNTISKNLGSKSAKSYLGTDDLRGLDWSQHTDAKIREAILVAVSVLSRG